MISTSELSEALPVIASLIVLEGLLSLDNVLGIASMAAHLPRDQQARALRLGFLGAYLFRGIALAAASWIIRHDWARIAGAVYLIYVMCAHLAPGRRAAGAHGPLADGFLRTVLKIELLDLSLSLDNVIAASAMSRRFWVICAGVFIGMLISRMLAGFAFGLIRRFPILTRASFLLVGFIGLTLLGEIASGLEMPALWKFAGIALILAAVICFERYRERMTAIDPLLRLGLGGMGTFAKVVEALFWPVRKAAASFLPRSAHVLPVEASAKAIPRS